METLYAICLGLGLGVAGGTAAAASGRLVATASPLMALAVLLGAVLALAGGLAREDPAAIAAIAGALGAFLAAGALGNLVAATHRRANSVGGVTLWLLAFAILVVALTLLLPPLALIAVVALAYLWLSRRRREARKYKGLRSLT